MSLQTYHTGSKFLLTELDLLPTACRDGFWRHSVANTTSDTTETIFNFLSQIVAWNISPGKHTTQNWLTSHVLIWETKHVPHKVSTWLRSTSNSQHWKRDNYINFHLFPGNDAWKTCPTLYRIQIYKSIHVLFSETSNTAQNMSFLLLKTRMHKHWTGDNCINFHLLPTNDGSKHIPCKTYQSNLQERPRSFWRS